MIVKIIASIRSVVYNRLEAACQVLFNRFVVESRGPESLMQGLVLPPIFLLDYIQTS
jgi:hypothetical protein